MILPLPTLIGLEVVIFAVLEYKRYEGFKKTGKVRARIGLPSCDGLAHAAATFRPPGITTRHRPGGLRM